MMFFNVFLVWLVQFLKKKKCDKSKFSYLALLFKHFKKKLKFSPLCEQQKKR